VDLQHVSYDSLQGVDMTKATCSLTTYNDEATVALVKQTDQKRLAIWAIECVERVMPYFEDTYPQDYRPRNALETLQTWIETGVFHMETIRKASLAAHAAGQAVATAHVPLYALGVANNVLQAIHRATNSSDADAAVAKERTWQLQHLCNVGTTHV